MTADRTIISWNLDREQQNSLDDGSFHFVHECRVSSYMYYCRTQLCTVNVAFVNYKIYIYKHFEKLHPRNKKGEK